MDDYEWKDRHITTERVKTIRRASVAFVNDYGPLRAANGGDAAAANEVVTKLFTKLVREGIYTSTELKQSHKIPCTS